MTTIYIQIKHFKTNKHLFKFLTLIILMEGNLNHKSLRKQSNTATSSFDEIPHKQGGQKGNAQESMVSDTGNIVEAGNAASQNVEGNMEDSFQRLYSKELDLDEDEVPIILHELNDSAIHFISRDQYERALSLLQKAQTLIDRLQFQKNPADRLMVYLTMHNMALCFQKLGALEECALCLEASLQTLNSPFLNLKLNQEPNAVTDPSKKLKRLKYECKTHMQVCALLSQLHRHKEALVHAERSVQIAQYMIEDMLQMCQFYYQKVLVAKRNEQIAQDLIQSNEDNDRNMKDLIYYDDSVSMLERTAFRVFPIIQECASKLISLNNLHSETLYSRSGDQQFQTIGLNQTKPRLNMKAVLGYLNQSEWLYLLNIGNIMQITPMTVHDLYTTTAFEVELTRDSILEKISFLAVSYFCISTELRFLFQMKNNEDGVDPLLRKRESEFWHAKALDVAISFLPSECPLVTHILTSYQKHHAPVQQEIPEDAEINQGIKIIRPMPGIDISKFQPIVRQDPSLAIQIAPLPLSPNNYSYISSIRKEGFFPLPVQKQSNNQQPNHDSLAATNTNNGNNQNLLQVSVTVNHSQQQNHLRKPSNHDEQFTNRFAANVSQDFQEGEQQQHQLLQISGMEEEFEEDYEEENNPLLTEQNTSIAQPQATKFSKQGMVKVQPPQMINDDSSSVHSQEEPAPADYSASDVGEDNRNNRYFENDNTSKEVSLIFDRNNGKKQQKSLEGNKKRFQQQQQIEIVNRTFEEEDSIDLKGGWVNKQKNHNLSIEEKLNVKRPKTSQGVRTSSGIQKAKSTSLQQNSSLKQTAKAINNQQQTQQLQKNSASMERIVSPNQDQLRPSGRGPHHQSMITHHSVSSTKIIKPTATQTNFHTNKNQQQRTPLKQQNPLTRDGSTGRGGISASNNNNNTTSQVIQAATQMIMMMNASNGYNNSRTAQQQERIDSTNQMKTNLSSQSDIALRKQQRSTRSGGKNRETSTTTPSQPNNPTPISKRLSTNPSNTNITSGRQQQQGPKIKKSELQAVIMNMGEPGQSNSQTRRYVQDQLEMLIKKKGFQVVDQQKQPSQVIQQQSFDNGLSQSMIEKNRNPSNMRSKSRGKTVGTTSRSKERMKIRSTDNQAPNSTMLEELQKQILIRAAQNRKGGSNVIQIKKSTQNPEFIQYNSQHIPQQQWFSSGSLQPPQQQQTQQSTHQVIKKFLQDRQQQNNNTSFDSYSLNQSTGNSNNPQQQQQQQAAISNYKMQLSRKILQQQQKLIGVAAIQQAQFVGPNPGFLVKNQEIHPLAAVFGQGHTIKRSATPMVEMHDLPPSAAINKSKTNTNSIPSLRLQALLNNTNLNQQPQADNQGLMYLPISQKATPDPSMHDVFNRDESLMKSAKKKILAKKSTPKNTASIMPSNSQQYLTQHQNIHM